MSCPSSKQSPVQILAIKPSPSHLPCTSSPFLCVLYSNSEPRENSQHISSLCRVQTLPPSIISSLWGPMQKAIMLGSARKGSHSCLGSILVEDGHSRAARSDGAHGLTRLCLPCWPCMGHQLGKPGVLGQGLPGAGSYESSTHQS